MNGRVAVQYQPSDALVLTLDANYARANLDEDLSTYALWNNQAAMTNLTRASDGTITYFNRQAPTDFDDVRSQAVQQTYNYGLNGKWTVNEHVTVSLDLDQAMSSLNPGNLKHFSEVSADIGYGPSQGACTNVGAVIAGVPVPADYSASCAVANYPGGTNGMNFSVTRRTVCRPMAASARTATPRTS